MRYTADTGFFIKLSQDDKKAQSIWKEIREGKGRLIIPAPVIAETAKNVMVRGKQGYLAPFYNALESSTKITVVDTTFDLARHAGKLAYSYNISAVDGCVLATAIATGYDTVITTDTYFRRAKKEHKIKLIEL
jgi:predicted nucleic acid-binding protein